MELNLLQPTDQRLAAVACFGAAAALCLAARLWPGRWVRPAAILLGAFVPLSEAAWIASLVVQQRWTLAVGLPLQLCDAATLLTAAALWTRRRWLVELLWFWACAGTVQALITPDVQDPFPTFAFLEYYAVHGGIVVSALLLVIGLKISPRPGAVRRSILITLAYTACVGFADFATGGDYMFLRQPPPAHTLFDLMGPWPWYLVGATALGVVLFLLLYAPFWWAHRRSQRRWDGESVGNMEPSRITAQ
ncbi:MAG: TIGR02206 family membrane protein [Candidatus Dormibacteraeota bacterium]|nr:TIGR02206 family membrane protein [Candidatus Dormibacteraeota bacterium]